MNKAFLESLVGLSLEAAEAKVTSEAEGFVCVSLPTGTILSAVARPNMVLVYYDSSNTVEHAAAGDPVQLEDFEA